MGESDRSGSPVEDVTDLLPLLVNRGLVDVCSVAVGGPWWEFDHPSDLALGLDVVRRLDAYQAAGR